MYKSIAFLLYTFFGGYILFAQGPLDGYLKGKGILDFAPSLSINRASTFLGSNGAVYDETFQGTMLSLFAEYGVSKNLDLVATGAYVFTATQNSLQDGGLLAKYRPFYKESKEFGRLGILLGGGLTFPMTNYEPLATGAVGQKATTLPLRAIVQWETPVGIFFNITGGYSWRMDQLDNTDIATVRAQRPDYQPVTPRPFSTMLFKMGFPTKHFYTDAWFEWQQTSGGADYQPGIIDLPQAYGVTYTQAGGTIFYSGSGKNGVFASGAYIMTGRNTSRILRITLGAVVKIIPKPKA
jgi:hypothetical protein